MFYLFHFIFFTENQVIGKEMDMRISGGRELNSTETGCLKLLNKYINIKKNQADFRILYGKLS